MRFEETTTSGRRFWRRVTAVVGAAALTLTFFLVLPLIQAITPAPEPDLILTEVDTGFIPPPDVEMPDEEPEPEEPEPEPESLDLSEDVMLDLAQLEMALNPTLGDGWGAADFAVDLGALAGRGGDALDSAFSAAALDERPRVLHQQMPTMDAKMKQRAPGTVLVRFLVDAQGRVQNPIAKRSSDPVFEPATLAAIRQWRFQPGKRDGQAVASHIEIEIKFPKP